MVLKDKLAEILLLIEEFKGELPKHGWYPGPGESLEWWAGLSNPFYIAVTAALVVMCRWNVVERVFKRLIELGLSTPESLIGINSAHLAEHLRGLNFRLRKAKTIIDLARVFMSIDANRPVDELRSKLLEVKGLGNETVDSILLFAFNKPTIPISRQTTRVLQRYGIPIGSYKDLQKSIIEALDGDIYKLKLLHASMTVIAREYCKPQRPTCNKCPLKIKCLKGDF